MLSFLASQAKNKAKFHILEARGIGGLNFNFIEDSWVEALSQAHFFLRTLD